ncbi:hypothetical protein VKT23_011116 [Stygiomarasmius scandens]|uniref:HET-domain-containing protein n=1 Tax=Marasmiellus scandens TaxID=2682957 RepID=A0ABR1JAI7_9AGAR
MRLLNTGSFKLREFFTNTPPYAILSHTWEGEEVIFQDMQTLEVAERKAGWLKIANACAHARKYDFEWIWIDSCCINKESSAELSEALNSMYQYYLDAEVCYVYLSDVLEDPRNDPRDIQSTFRRSRWFTRGWTLQELLAPSYAVFLDCQWTEIGTKWSLRDVLSAITSIPMSVFEDGDLSEFSIAQKMSWVAFRETTRPEDRAYCLMGLFGINMPPIYGEGGQKAFMRLQQEIMKISDDRSIFAWIASPGDTEPRGLLAKSPYEFRASGDVGASDSSFLGNKSSFSFNNNGLHIHLLLLPVVSDTDGLFLAPLQCKTRDNLFLSLYLRRTSSGKYIRYRTSELSLTPTSTTLGIPQELVVTESQLPQIAKKTKSNCRLKMKLHLSAQSFIAYIDTYDLATGVFHRVWQAFKNGEIHLDDAIWHVLGLEYKDQTGERRKERILVRIKRDLSNIMHLKIFMVPHDDNFYGFIDNVTTAVHQKGCPDRVSRRLPGDNGEMTFSLHITGKNATLEINYLPQDLEKPISRGEIFTPPRLGFTATKLPWNDLCFHHVFPNDHFQVEHLALDSSEIYISLLNDPTQTNTFRILTYEFSARFNFYKIFVAVGNREYRTWIDVTAFPFRSSPKPKEIWDSYHDGGERAEVRMRCQSSASCSIQEGVLTVTVAIRRNLGLGSHFLDFKWIQKDKIERRVEWDESEIEDREQEYERDQSMALFAYTQRHERDRLVYWRNGVSDTTMSEDLY